MHVLGCLIVLIGLAQAQSPRAIPQRAFGEANLATLTNQLSPSVESTARLEVREYEMGKEVRRAEYLAWFKGRDALLLQVLAPETYIGRKILLTRHDLFVSLPEARRPLRLPLQQRMTSDVSYADMAWVNPSADYKQIAVETRNDKTLILIADTDVPVFKRIEFHLDKNSERPIKATFIGTGNVRRDCYYERFQYVLGEVRPLTLRFEDPTRTGWRAELTFVDWQPAKLPGRVFVPSALNKFRLADKTRTTAGLSFSTPRRADAPSMPTVQIPSGILLMGTDSGFPEERPRHPVKVAAFGMDRCEVSIEDYRRFVASKHNSAFEPSPIAEANAPNDYFSNPQYLRYPIVNVNWYAASAYCQWLGKRLPTESEWEWAARGSENRLYPWGNDWDAADLNGSASSKDVHFTSICGSSSRGASGFGVYDLAGNVAEWIADWYGPYPQSGADDPSFGKSYRVVRGGSWLSQPSGLTAVARDFADPSKGYESVGFRCVKDE